MLKMLTQHITSNAKQSRAEQSTEHVEKGAAQQSPPCLQYNYSLPPSWYTHHATYL